jgi:hypothetical protein
MQIIKMQYKNLTVASIMHTATLFSEHKKKSISYIENGDLFSEENGIAFKSSRVDCTQQKYIALLFPL